MNYTWILYSILALVTSTIPMIIYNYLNKIKFPEDLCISIILFYRV